MGRDFGQPVALLPAFNASGDYGVPEHLISYPLLGHVTGLPGSREDYEHVGGKNFFYDALKVIYEVIYVGVSACVDMLNDFSSWAGGKLYWEFPSGLCICIYDHDTVPDFRLPLKQFAFLALDFTPFGKYVLPFDNPAITQIGHQLHDATTEHDSDQWYYREHFNSGEIKRGDEYNPPRRYCWTYDFLEDITIYGLLAVVIYLFIRLGWLKGIAAICKMLWNNYRYQKEFNETKQAVQDAKDVTNMVKEIRQTVSDDDKITGQLQDQLKQGFIDMKSVMVCAQDDINRIKQIIGLKLSL